MATDNLPANFLGLNRFIFVAPLVIFVLFLGLKATHGDYYSSLTQEDGVLEYSQAAAYLSAAVLAFLVGNKFGKVSKNFHRALWCIFSVGCIFIALEEISWGERITGLGIQQLRASNLQHETTFHNLPVLQALFGKAEIVVGLVGGLAWIFFRQSSPIFPDRTLSIYFLVPALVYMFGAWSDSTLSPPFLLHQEIFELLTSMGFLLHAGMVYRNFPHRPDSAR